MTERRQLAAKSVLVKIPIPQQRVIVAQQTALLLRCDANYTNELLVTDHPASREEAARNKRLSGFVMTDSAGLQACVPRVL
jgi:hypothetical protein